MARLYNRIHHQTELRRKRQNKKGIHAIRYHVDEKVLIRNRQQPSSAEGIAKKLLLLYTGPYIISKDNGNNTYVIGYPSTNRVKATYNQTEIKTFYE